MPLKITTWNINSVRLRINLVAKFIKSARPDVICLQETKCPDDAFPLKRFKRLGYEHAALNGQKGYHGVAILSRMPFETVDKQDFCGKTDCRHISVVLGEKAGLKDPVTLHNFYVPAGGDEPDPEVNPKFEHKLSFLDEMQAHMGLRPARRQRAILVGDLNVAPLEHDVWSHKQMLRVFLHTPFECVGSVPEARLALALLPRPLGPRMARLAEDVGPVDVRALARPLVALGEAHGMPDDVARAVMPLLEDAARSARERLGL